MKTIWHDMKPWERVIGLLVACVFWAGHWWRNR